MRRESYFWGLFLVLLGILLLLDNLNILPADVNAWGLFWPIVLVAMGVRVLLPFVVKPGVRSAGEVLAIPLEAARSARIKVRHGAGELRIQPGAAAGSLLDGSFEGGVLHSVRRVGDSAEVELRLPDVQFNWIGDTHSLNWNIALSPEIPLALDLEVGASRNLLDLRGLRVNELQLSTGASDSEITLPEQGQVRAKVRSGAASVNVHIPQGVAARINARGGLAGISVDSTRFPRYNGLNQSPDYETAENRVELDIETGVGSVTVN